MSENLATDNFQHANYSSSVVKYLGLPEMSSVLVCTCFGRRRLHKCKPTVRASQCRRVLAAVVDSPESNEPFDSIRPAHTARMQQ